MALRTTGGGFTTVKSREAGGLIQIRTGRVSADHLAEVLRRLSTRVSNLQPALDEFGRYMVESHITQQFARQGFPKRWALLSPAYAEAKRRKWGNQPLLVASGDMRAGFRWKAGPRSLRIINRVKSRQKGRGVPRWQYHQTGTSNMPARPMIQMRREDIDILLHYVLVHAAFDEWSGGVL